MRLQQQVCGLGQGGCSRRFGRLWAVARLSPDGAFSSLQSLPAPGALRWELKVLPF